MGIVRIKNGTRQRSVTRQKECELKGVAMPGYGTISNCMKAVFNMSRKV